MQDQLVIKLELTVDQVNLILKCLGKHPFEEVVTLMTTIKTQGDAQVVPPGEASPT